MKKLYEKSEIWFSVVWIVAYVVLASAGDNISTSIGISKIVTLPVLMVLSVALFFFVKRNGLTEKYGLCKPQIFSAKGSDSETALTERGLRRLIKENKIVSVAIGNRNLIDMDQLYDYLSGKNCS